MRFENNSQQLLEIFTNAVQVEHKTWFDEKLTKIITKKSKRELYLTYSLIASKIQATTLDLGVVEASALTDYLQLQHTNAQELVRMYLFVEVLNADSDFFSPLVANIIQVADTSELVTFLKFLIVLPNPEYYQHTAVEALRTNIATVFDAIALQNPYPSLYFSPEQWNQMYLKAAFMERDLTQIVAIDKMANKALAKIISDYAHERWKASREVLPYFWRPVSNFIDEVLIKDMQRLFASKNVLENDVAALCCYKSDNAEATSLLAMYPELIKRIENKQLNWEAIIQSL